MKQNKETHIALTDLYEIFDSEHEYWILQHEFWKVLRDLGIGSLLIHMVTKTYVQTTTLEIKLGIIYTNFCYKQNYHCCTPL